MADEMVRASAAGGYVRAFAVSARDVAERARQMHEMSPVATAALGRTMNAALMMGMMMKGEKDLLSLCFRGDGPIGGITVSANANGEVKGYVGNPAVMLPPKADGHFDVGGAVGQGYLQVLRDIGLKEPYSGEVDIQSGEIAEDIAYYYVISEQLPTVTALGVLMNKDNTVRESGGYLIQLMPGCPEEVIAKLEERAMAVPPVTEMLRSGMSPEDMLTAVLGEMELQFLAKMPVCFHCNCSKERVAKALLALGEAELQKIIADQKEETLHCAFCNSDYSFSVAEMQAILQQAVKEGKTAADD